MSLNSVAWRVSKQQLFPDFSLGFVIELRKEGHEEQGSTASPH